MVGSGDQTTTSSRKNILGPVTLAPFPPGLLTPRMKAVYTLWQRVAAHNPFPSQANLLASVLADHRDNIILYQFDNQSGRPLVASSGHLVNALIGFEPRGLFVDDFPGTSDVVARLTWMRDHATAYVSNWMPLPATVSVGGPEAPLREHAILALPIGTVLSCGTPKVTAVLVLFEGR